MKEEPKDPFEILRELYPNLTDEQLEEVRGALDEYFRLVVEIWEQSQDSSQE